jgi:hypothetical protein
MPPVDIDVRVNGNRTQSYPGAEHNVVSLVKVKVFGFGSKNLKTCDRDSGIIFQIEIACGILFNKKC